MTTLYFTNPGFNYSERYSQQFSPHFYKLGTELTYNDSAMYAKIALGYNTRRFTDQQNIFLKIIFKILSYQKAIKTTGSLLCQENIGQSCSGMFVFIIPEV